MPASHSTIAHPKPISADTHILGHVTLFEVESVCISSELTQV